MGEPGRSDESSLMIYDGDCGFCTYWAKRWAQKLTPFLEIAPFQEEKKSHQEKGRASMIPVEDLEEAVHLVEPDGSIYRGAAAIFRALALKRKYRFGWWLYRFFPGFDSISEIVYRWVARNRMKVSQWTTWMRKDI